MTTLALAYEPGMSHQDASARVQPVFCHGGIAGATDRQQNPELEFRVTVKRQSHPFLVADKRPHLVTFNGQSAFFSVGAITTYIAVPPPTSSSRS